MSADVLVDPCNEVVLECSFDDLVKNVWCDQFIYVGSRKIFSEGLENIKRNILMSDVFSTYHNISHKAILLPQFTHFERFEGPGSVF